MYITCPCKICGGNLEFESQHLGTKITCPHCQCETELYATPQVAVQLGGQVQTPPILSSDFKAAAKTPTKKSFHLPTWAYWVIVPVIACIGFMLLAWLQSQMSPGSNGNTVTFLVFVAAMVCIYFLPAAIARRKRNFPAILALNVLVGWTFIGWVAAFVWALTKEKE